MVALELIKSMNAFKGLNEEQLNIIQNECELCEYYLNNMLFREGEDARHLWIILEGQVDLRFEMPDKRPTTIDQTISKIDVNKHHPESKVLGWSCFIPPYKMRLSAYCVTEMCRIVRIEKNALLAIFDRHPEIGYTFLSYLIQVVGYRFHQFQDQVAQNLGEELMNGW